MSDREPSDVDLNEQVLDSLATLRTLLGGRIALSASLTPRLGVVRVDPSALREAILQVVTNVRKSMPNGGSMLIETENISLASRHVELGVAPGQYVCLTLSNTGAMVTPEEDGSMATLLTSVCAFAKRFGGTATMRSEPEQGTAVRLYLPTI